MYRDTDSLFYVIETDGIYRNLAQLILDLSDYPKDHHFHRKLDKKLQLNLSDELNDENVTEAVFIKSKTYPVKILQTL